MVTVTIDRQYLHYINPDLDRACQLKDDHQFAYCQFLPDGMSCNVISWQCMDIRNLLFEDGMGEVYRKYYEQSMAMFKESQQAEKECLDNVKKDLIDEIEGAKQYYANVMQSFANLISDPPPLRLITHEVSKKETEDNNNSNQQLAVLPETDSSLVKIVMNIHIFVGVFVGETCYNNGDLEIHLLPSVEMVGFVGLEEKDAV